MVIKKKFNFIIGSLSLLVSIISFGIFGISKIGFAGRIEQVPVDGPGIGYLMVIGLVFLLISLMFFMKKSEEELGFN